jgi:hypothetical protein
MLRRAFFISSALGTLSAAAALAFAPDLTRMAVSTWRMRGFTPVPAAGITHGAASGVLTPVADTTAAGEFCRFPRPATSQVAQRVDSPLVTADSDTVLPLEGQSTVSPAPTEAKCTGGPPPKFP